MRLRRVRTLGVEVDGVTLAQASTMIIRWLSEGHAECRYVVTPNLDHAVLLSEMADFREAYAGAALVLADGAPLLWGARINGSSLPERVAGSDLGPRVLDEAPEGTRIFLLGGTDEASAAAVHNIAAAYPGVRIVGRSCPPLGFERDPALCNEIVALIESSRAQLVIVGLGAPKQELWVHSHREGLRGKTVLCLGATIDFLAKHRQRAPLWMQNNGLEWIHRLWSEPRRLTKRYAKDAVRLPGLIVRDAWQLRFQPRSGR